MKTIFNVVVVLSLLCFSAAQAQTDEKEVDLYDLSLEELLNIPIQSASKKEETLFDAPLSSYTITRADIDKAGSTSIMEALRLAPGVIVREQTNGVYDIHIRGLDNIQRTSEAFTKSNLTTLVMIDNRPVFNHNLGGTFWEALPINLNDVDRIEIVRGPSAPLFGPNAVTGVINIITKRASSKNYVSANAQYGTPSTLIGNLAFGKKINDKFNFAISGNMQNRDRFDENYYRASDSSYVPVSEIVNNASRYFPNPNTALKNWGVNGFFNYKATEKISFDLSVGTQASETQKVFLSGATLFTTHETETQYANLAAKIHGLTLRTSYINGHDDLNKGGAPNQYDYNVADVVAEYEISLGKKVTVVPGVSYQTVTFSDKDYVAESDSLTFLGGDDNVNITTSAAFLRIDARPIEKLRIIAGIRADKFSAPDDVYLAYEFATTYKINDKNLIRAAITRSNSGSFIGLNYLDLSTSTPIPGVDYTRTGNTNLNLFTVNMIEVGYRALLAKNLQLDIDLFNQVADNYTALMVSKVVNIGVIVPVGQEFQNVPTTAVQNGVTIGINYVPSDKLQIKPFVTIQKTETRDLPSAYVSTSIDPTITYTTSDHKNTPSFYGGYSINYKPVSKLNLNLNGYYFAAHRQYDGSDRKEISAAGNIKGKFLVNLKANLSVTKQFNLFASGRNIFNSNSREFFGADQIGGLYTVGASFQMN